MDSITSVYFDSYNNIPYAIDKFREFYFYWETRKIKSNGKIIYVGDILIDYFKDKSKNKEKKYKISSKILEIEAGWSNMSYEDFPFDSDCRLIIKNNKIIGFYNIISTYGIYEDGKIEGKNRTKYVNNLLISPDCNFGEILNHLVKKCSYGSLYTNPICDFFDIIGSGFEILELEPIINLKEYLKTITDSVNGIYKFEYTKNDKFYIFNKYFQITQEYKIKVNFDPPFILDNNKNISNGMFIVENQEFTRNFEIFDEPFVKDNHKITRRFIIFDKPILLQFLKDDVKYDDFITDDIIDSVSIYYENKWNLIPLSNEFTFSSRTLYYTTGQKTFVYGFIIPSSYTKNNELKIYYETYECLKPECDICKEGFDDTDFYDCFDMFLYPACFNKSDKDVKKGIYGFSKFISKMKNLKINTDLRDRIKNTIIGVPDLAKQEEIGLTGTFMDFYLEPEKSTKEKKIKDERILFKKTYLYNHSLILLNRWLRSEISDDGIIQTLQYRYKLYSNDPDYKFSDKIVAWNYGKKLIMNKYYLTDKEKCDSKIHERLRITNDNKELEKLIENMKTTGESEENIIRKEIDFLIRGKENTYVIMINEKNKKINYELIEDALFVNSIEEHTNTNIFIFEIDADWILSRSKKPNILKFKCIAKPEYEMRIRF